MYLYKLKCNRYRFTPHRVSHTVIWHLDHLVGYFVIKRCFTGCTKQTHVPVHLKIKKRLNTHSCILFAFKQNLTLSISGPWSTASCTDAPPASEGVHLSMLLIQEAVRLKEDISPATYVTWPHAQPSRCQTPDWHYRYVSCLWTEETRPESKRALPFSALHSFFFLLMVPWCEGFW